MRLGIQATGFGHKASPRRSFVFFGWGRVEGGGPGLGLKGGHLYSAKSVVSPALAIPGCVVARHLSLRTHSISSNPRLLEPSTESSMDRTL